MKHKSAILTAALALGGVAVSPFPGMSQKVSKPDPIRASTASSKDSAPAVVLVGAGDIASCNNLPGGEATAKLLDNIPGTVFADGDLAYDDGTAQEFKNCYEKTWGRHKDRTRPAVGNHEYHTPGAAAYYGYWGQTAGEKGKGWYSYDLGSWHIVVVNSNCAEIGGCQSGSPQEEWVRHDLAAHKGVCTLAYWHHPLFSSGIKPEHAIHPEMKPIWTDLYESGTALVVNGHEHNYERFALQDPSGKLDPARGIREIVVGTGGRNHKPFGTPLPNSEIRNADTYGVLKLTLRQGNYEWQFIPEQGKSFTDSGTGTCTEQNP